MSIQQEIIVPAVIQPYIFGRQDSNIKIIEKNLDVKLSALGDNITISSPKEENIIKAKTLFEELMKTASKREISSEDVVYAVKMVSKDNNVDISGVLTEHIKVGGWAKVISAKSQSQKEYIKAISSSDMIFGIGPAGTGKTYLAMAMAVNHFLSKKVARIILARPAVEAGEKLGFLPGDIADKINPYLRPLYDALYTMMDIDYVTKLIEKNVIEVAPLAFMRGRTLNDSFVILDEAQNTTEEQMKMFLTRLGFNSKAVITGDVTQIDLPSDKRSGLVTAINVLSNIPEIKFINFSDKDVVRHPLVSKIVRAYDKAIHRD